jgi:WD40 repeat protein
MVRESIDFRSERGRHETLLGREHVLAELERLLGHGGDTRGWVLVKGGPGMGKSALLAHYLQRMEDQGQRVPHHFLRRGVEDWDRPEVVVRNLAAQLEALFPEQAHPEARPESRLREVLQRVSAEVLVPRGERLLLVIDGLDEAEPGAGGQNPLPRFLPDSLPPGVRVLCASRPTYPFLSWLEARDRVRRIDLDDARWAGSNEEVVRTYWEHAALRFEPPLAPALIAEAVLKARGNILYTLKLSDWLQEQPEERRRAELLPQGLEAILVEVWQRLLALPVHERTVALTGLGLIAAAREALPHSVLAELAGWRDVETGERFLHATRPFLLEEPGHWRGERAWRPFHESFREFIVRTLGVEGLRREHRRLAEQLCAWPVEAVGHDFRRHYALRHGVVHWLEAGDWQRVRALCTDVGYLEAKCRETEVSALEEDLSRAAASSTGKERGLAHELLRAVQHGSHWLRQDPRAPGALPQILYNQLRSSGWTGARIEETLSFPEGLPALRLRHPVRMSGSEIRTLLGHTDSVLACTVLPDGRRALSASWDETLRLWDLETGLCLATLQGHTSFVNACTVLPDGRRALSASYDRTLKLWDLETGLCLATLEGHTGSVTACTVLPDGRRALSASYDRTLKLWDLETGPCLATLQGHTNSVLACTVLPDGRRALSASDDDTLKLWDLETGLCLATLEGHTGFVTACTVLPDGRRALSASDDHTLKLWGLETGLCLATLEGHTNSVKACTVLPDGRRALSASYDYTLKLWDLETGLCLATLQGHTGSVHACTVLPDGRRALSASDDHTLKLWDLETGLCLATLQGHTGSVHACTVLPDGRRALSASSDYTLKLWDLETGLCLATLEGHTGFVTACTVLPDGRRALSASSDWTLKLWDLETGLCLATLQGHTDFVLACTVLPDGRRALSASDDNTLKLWDLHSGECLQTLHGRGAFRCVAIAGDVICAGDVLNNVWILEANPRPQKLPERGTPGDDREDRGPRHRHRAQGRVRVFKELLPTELRAERDETTGQYDYTFQLPGSPHRCVVSFIGEMNPEPAALHTERLLSKWNPRTVVMLGIASDPVVGAAQEFSHWLRSSRDRNLKALDMESAGLVASAFKRVNPTRTLVLRGISDYGDERKATLDALGEGSLRRLAMHNATSLLWTLLRAGVLPRATE